MNKIPILITKKNIIHLGDVGVEYKASFGFYRTTFHTKEKIKSLRFDLDTHEKESIARALYRDIMSLKTDKLHELEMNLLKVVDRNNREHQYIKDVFREIYVHLDTGYSVVEKDLN